YIIKINGTLVIQTGTLCECSYATHLPGDSILRSSGHTFPNLPQTTEILAQTQINLYLPVRNQ
ncbi:MAG: hypothetical protein IJV55_03395, partial [Paludibacteraceae bacterium]|nr:hypothetical protein [Paludibacteraceae bacterium]